MLDHLWCDSLKPAGRIHCPLMLLELVPQDGHLLLHVPAGKEMLDILLQNVPSRVLANTQIHGMQEVNGDCVKAHTWEAEEAAGLDTSLPHLRPELQWCLPMSPPCSRQGASVCMRHTLSARPACCEAAKYVNHRR